MRTKIEQNLLEIKTNKINSIEFLEDTLIETYRLLDSEAESDYNLCLSVICHIADSNYEDLMVDQLLHDCIVKSRIFLYDGLLHKNHNKYNPLVSTTDQIIESFYTSGNTNSILTKPQKQIFDKFQKAKRLIVSAPTSFGKTRIIREIIAHNQYQNIAIIMPTVSLLSEQYQYLKKNVSGYILSKSSKVVIQPNHKYILILTPERISAFLEDNPDFRIDFFVMDEIYKIDYKLQDDRFRIFSDVLYKLSKTNADFYLIGPYINEFSKKFRAAFNADFIKFNLEIVQKDFHFFDSIKNKGTHQVQGEAIRIIGDKFKNLLRLVTQEKIDGKFLIYRYQKQYVEDTAIKFLETWPVSQTHNKDLVEYLSSNVSEEWELVSCIKRGVAFHHGAMPRHIQDLIVDEFNSPGGIDYLFCTTSLTEGINSAAKNVVIYDNKIGGGELLKTLDRKNIEGRAGRFMQHFVGRVFLLETSELEDDDTFVEIEFLDCENPSLETLVQLDEIDLTESNKALKQTLSSKLNAFNIPEAILKVNKFVCLDGQISLINHLRNSNTLNEYYFNTSLPTLELTRNLLSVIYDFIFTDHDKGKNFNNEVGKSILIGLTNYYIYYQPTFKQLLISDTVVNARTKVNSRIRFVFDLTTKYFEFVWPRYIKAFANLFNYVAHEKNLPTINLDLLIAQLEYGTTKSHEILLRDSGIPREIIKKISVYFKDCETFDEIQAIILSNKRKIYSSVEPIEMKILDKYL
ncbi:MAG: DEAD/DEAH box helicase [Pseudomonadota bacterium]